MTAPAAAHRKRKAHDMLSVAILNHSAHPGLTPAVLGTITHALARQLVEHVGPLCQIIPPSLAYLADGHAPAGVSPLVLFDDADQADALGYHDIDPHGLPYGRVFVHTILDAGGSLYQGPTSVSVTLSHELLEMVGDPGANRWADNVVDGYGYAIELCDAVEGDSYEIDGVHVSNFVLPSYFDAMTPRTARFDFLARLPGPFTMTRGGYLIRRNPTTGIVSNIFGEHFPEWKKALKAHPAARTSRRAKGN